MAAIRYTIYTDTESRLTNAHFDLSFL